MTPSFAAARRVSLLDENPHPAPRPARRDVGPDRPLVLDGDEPEAPLPPASALKPSERLAPLFIADEVERIIAEQERAYANEVLWTGELARAREDLSLAKSRPWTATVKEAAAPGDVAVPRPLVDGKNAEQREAQVRQALATSREYTDARDAVWEAERQLGATQNTIRINDRRLDFRLALLNALGRGR